MGVHVHVCVYNPGQSSRCESLASRPRRRRATRQAHSAISYSSADVNFPTHEGRREAQVRPFTHGSPTRPDQHGTFNSEGEGRGGWHSRDPQGHGGGGGASAGLSNSRRKVLRHYQLLPYTHTRTVHDVCVCACM